MKKFLLSIILLLALAYLFKPATLVHADKVNPQSTNYILTNFGFGSGGTASSSSTNYSLFGISGENTSNTLSSTNYKTLPGLVYTLVASVPAAPTFTNPSNYYNKLQITLNQSKDPSDFKYAIAISKDNFATDTEYIQQDNTVSTNFSVLNFRSYSSGVSNWGGSSGITIVGLQPNTTYTVKVASRQGFYTQSPWGPTASAATINPTMSFSLSPNSINIGSLTPGTVGTSGTVTATVSTNGTGGAIIYGNDTNSGLLSSSTSYTISAVSNNLDTISEGYGIIDTSVTQTSGGPMESISPYNGTGNTVGTINTTQQILFDSSNQPVTSGQANFQVKAKPSATAKAASDYADTLTIIGSASF